MPTIKKLYFSSGVAVTAPTDLISESSSTHVNEYVDDAAFVTANGTAAAGDIYINSTLKALRMYTGSAWRSVIMSTDDADATKTFLVDLDGATTGTTATLDFNQSASRVYTFPNVAGTLGLVPASGPVRSDGTVLSTGATALGSEVSGTLPIANGGSGQTTANTALNAFLPSQATNNGKFLQTDGTNTSWVVASGGSTSEVTVAKSADYTILDSDTYTTILVTTAGTNRTITLPTVADNTHRLIKIKKVDSGVGTVIVDGEGSETIDGATTQTLLFRYSEIAVQSDGASWHIVSYPEATGTQPGLMHYDPINMDNVLASKYGFKTYLHGTTYNGGNAPTITPSSGTVSRGVFIPYQPLDGVWRLRFNITITGTTNGATFTVNSVTNTYDQGFSGSSDVVPDYVSGFGLFLANDTFYAKVTGSGSVYLFGDVELTAKPNWVY